MLHTLEKREVRVESKVAAASMPIDDTRWVTVVYDAYEDPPKLTLVIHEEILTPEDLR